MNAFVVCDVKAFYFKDSLARFCGCFINAQQHFAANHQLGQLLWACLRCLDRGGHFTAPHYADGIGDIHNFTQLVCDEDNRFSFGLQALQDAEKLICLCGG